MAFQYELLKGCETLPGSSSIVIDPDNHAALS